MRVVGEIKCYHCGHISGEVEGTRTDRLVLDTFRPRPGYRGALPKRGQQLRCERCQGPVYIEDFHPISLYPEPFQKAPPKKPKSSRTKAA